MQKMQFKKWGGVKINVKKTTKKHIKVIFFKHNIINASIMILCRVMILRKTCRQNYILIKVYLAKCTKHSVHGVAKTRPLISSDLQARKFWVVFFYGK